MLFLKLLLICSAMFAVILLFGYLLWRQRAFFSRVMDRNQMRPSQVSGALQIGFGLFGLLIVHGLPLAIMAMQVFYGIFAAIMIANGIDKLRNPPDQEYRPPWYVGDGDPDWLPLTEAARNRKFTFRLSWIVTVIFVLCVALASFSFRLESDRKKEQKRADAVAKIEQLGGAVQGRDITLAGTSVTDADLVVLAEFEDLRELNLGATSITNEGLREVAKLSQLSRLNLSGTQVDDEGLHWLSRLKRLGTLNLRKTKVTGQTFPVAKNRTRKLVLDLSLCPVTKDGLRALARTPRLLQLNLNETEIDDTMLEEIKAIETVGLDISKTNISQEGADQIEAARAGKSTIRTWGPTSDAK